MVFFMHIIIIKPLNWNFHIFFKKQKKFKIVTSDEKTLL